MSQRSVDCVDIYSLDRRISLYLRLILPGLFLLILSAVILIVSDSHAVVRHFVGGCKFSRNLAVEGGKWILIIKHNHHQE